MAVDHTMTDLRMTWWDLLQKIATKLHWSYAALWETPDGRVLKLKQGYFNFHAPTSNGEANRNAELFHSLYGACTFTDGFGFAGHANMTKTVLWLTKTQFASVEQPHEQTVFLEDAGIQTVVCLPLLGNSLVLELGNAKRVLNTDDVASDIRKCLHDLFLPYLINKEDSTKAQGLQDQFDHPVIMRTPLSSSRAGQFGNSNHHTSTLLAAATESEMVPATNDLNLCSPSLEGLDSGLQQLGPIYQELMQEQESFTRQVARGFLDNEPRQVPIEFPKVAEPNCRGRLTWVQEVASPILQMESNRLESWIPTLADSLSGRMSTSSATSAHLADEILPTEIGQFFPFSLVEEPPLSAFMGAEQNIIGGGASLRTSSSMSSIRSQNMEDNEISSAILESYPEMGNGFHHRSGSTGPGESENLRRGRAQESSGPSSKEPSPDSNVATRSMGRRYGIHPRISSTPSDKFESLAANAMPQQQKPERLERRYSNAAEQQEDATPRLVKFGNVLQLGNASGQLVEPLPQQHDEAAVSHMMAERRRRIRQNENFTLLKALIPSAGKMDKASLLAATIGYINQLHERLADLGQNEESLTLPSAAEQEQISSVKSKGSPRPRRGRSPKSSSSTEEVEERIQAYPSGDGNLKIEIRNNNCTQPDAALLVFTCLRELHFKVINANVLINDNRINASLVVKMKRKNSTGQAAVCAEVEEALKICLMNNLG